jgi:hypothetical protein
MEEEIRALKKMLEAQRIEIDALKSRLAAYESAEAVAVETANSMAVLPLEPELSKEDVAKFSRQMILPEFRAKGQLALKVVDGHLLTYSALPVHVPLVLRIRCFFFYLNERLSVPDP